MSLLGKFLEKAKENRQKLAKNPRTYRVIFWETLSLQAIFLTGMVQMILAIVSRVFYVNNAEFFHGIQHLDVELYVLVASTLFGFLRWQGRKSVHISLAGFFAVLMVTCVQVFKALSPDFVIPTQADGMLKQTIIFAPLTVLFVSMLGVAWNLLCVIGQSLDESSHVEAITQDPEVKSAVVQPSPSPTDLAQDLRLSRSHARRRPVRCRR